MDAILHEPLSGSTASLLFEIQCFQEKNMRTYMIPCAESTPSISVSSIAAEPSSNALFI
jgi:hypothetical protein